MGSVHKLSELCCTPQRTLSAPHSHTFLTILKDKHYFQHSHWHTNQSQRLFDPRSFLLLFFQLQSYDCACSPHWIPIDLTKLSHGRLEATHEGLDKQFKFLIRKGVPLKLVRTVILNMFKKSFESNEENYLSTLDLYFQGKIPKAFKNVPVFDCLPYFQSLKLPFLNPNGHKALARILWCIRKRRTELQYNPLVAKISAILLVFLSEGETFEVVDYMVNSSIQILKEESAQYLHWHFTMNETQFRQLGSAFIETANKLSKTFKLIYQHLQSIKFNFQNLFATLVNNLFLGFLPFKVVFRVWLIFLNQGVKTLFSMVYALLRVHAKEILANSIQSTMTETIRKLSINMSEETADLFIKKAFSLSFDRLDNVLDSYKVSQASNKVNVYYFPCMPDSNLLQSWHLEAIWDWLPPAYKTLNPKRIWATERDGHSQSAFLERSKQYYDYPSLLIIKTKDNHLLGAFSDEMIRLHQSDYLGTNATFLFMLDHKDPFHLKPSNLDDHFLQCCEKRIAYGDGGLVVQNLQKGYCGTSQTFSGKLLNSKFQISSAELHYLL